jgi:hypothetical protein
MSPDCPPIAADFASVPVGFCSGGDFFRREKKIQAPRAIKIRRPPTPAPTPIPMIAPVDRPCDVDVLFGGAVSVPVIVTVFPPVIVKTAVVLVGETRVPPRAAALS